jgi:hypothetical protein
LAISLRLLGTYSRPSSLPRPSIRSAHHDLRIYTLVLSFLVASVCFSCAYLVLRSGLICCPLLVLWTFLICVYRTTLCRYDDWEFGVKFGLCKRRSSQCVFTGQAVREARRGRCGLTVCWGSIAVFCYCPCTTQPEITVCHATECNGQALVEDLGVRPARVSIRTWYMRRANGHTPRMAGCKDLNTRSAYIPSAQLSYNSSPIENRRRRKT